MDAMPEIKSANLKDTLKYISGLPEPYPEKIHEQIHPETFKAIQESTKIKWLPVTLDKEVTEAVHRALNDEDFFKFWQDFGLSALKSPVLRHAFNAARRLFGLTTSKLITWTPRAFNGYYRNCGELVVGERSENHCNLIQQGFPGHLMSFGYMLGFAFTYSAIFPLTKVEGQVTLRDYNPDQGSVRFHFKWKSRES